MTSFQDSCLSFHDFDFGGGEGVKVIDQGVNLAVGFGRFGHSAGDCLCPVNASMPRMVRHVVSTFATPSFLPVAS
jgi:hypothetical protein